MPAITQRALITAAIAAGLQISGLWQESPAMGWLARLVLCMLCLGLLYEGLRHAVARLEFEVCPIDLGEAATVAVRAATRDGRGALIEYLPPAPGCARVANEGRRVVVPRGAAAHDAYPVEPLRLGPHALGRVRGRVLGPLGLAWWGFEADSGAELRVRPGRLTDDERRRALVSGGATVQPVPGGGRELLQLRPYRESDPPRAIDWRATARSGALVSREFGEEQRLDIVLAVDAGRYSRLEIDGNDRFGHYAHVASRFAERAILADDRVGLVVFAERVLSLVPLAGGAAGLSAVRDALSGIVATDTDSDLVGASLAVRRLARSRSLVVVLTDLDDPRGDGPLTRAVTLLRPAHQPLIAGLRSQGIESLAGRRTRTWRDVYTGIAADARIDATAATMTRLRLLGVPVVLAPLPEFERSVLASFEDLRARRRV